MPPSESIFLDFSLPTPTTWFYFGVLLAGALFVKFSRLLSMRNLDVVLVFLPVPGLLLLLQSPGIRSGFGWLLGAAMILLIRCLLDLALERRPALSPNLSPGGLVWLGGALFVSLIIIAVREPRSGNSLEHRPPPLAAGLTEVGGQLLDRQGLPDRDLTVERALAVLCHLAVVVALVLVGWQHFRDIHAGIAMPTFYLLLPYTYLLLPFGGDLKGEWFHVWPTALLAWAVVLYRRPTLAGLLLGVAAASVYHPVLIIPVWLGFYGKKGGGRFLAAGAMGALLCFLLLLVRTWIAEGGLPENLANVWPLEVQDWLPWVSPDRSPNFWRGVHWAYRMPVFLLYLVLVLVVSFWPSPKNLAHLIALSAALLLGAQLWYADHGGIQVLWYLPLLLMMLFRPNLTTCQAAPLLPETDWLHGLRRKLRRAASWLLGRPETAVPAQG